MSTSQNISHTNEMLVEFKQRIAQLEEQSEKLQEEIRLMEQFYDRIDDL
jgi:hypothetical protein